MKPFKKDMADDGSGSKPKVDTFLGMISLFQGLPSFSPGPGPVAALSEGPASWKQPGPGDL